MLRFVVFSFAFVVVASSVSEVHAVNKTWTSGVSGDFTDATKWTGGVPGAADTATFNAAGIYTITFDNVPIALANPVLNQDLFLQAGTVTFTSGAGGPYTYRLTGAGGDDAVVTGGSLTLGTSGNPLHLTVDDDLRVRGNATLLAQFGSDITTTDLILGDSTAPTGDGTLTLDGTGSTLTVNGSAELGTGGRTGTVTVRNGATADFNGTLRLAFPGSHFSNGVVNVQSGSSVTAANILIGPNATNGQTGTLNVGNGSGTSTVTQDNNATLVVGAAVGSGPTPNTGTLNVNAGGVFNSGGGTGSITVNPTGTINVTGGGELNANGSMTINGALTVNGVSSEWSVAGATVIGTDGATANVTLSNIARTTHGSVELANSSTAGTTANLNIESGAAFQPSGSVLIATMGGATTAANININGSGSRLDQSGAFPFTIGHASTGTVNINLGTTANQGSLEVGTGLLTINRSATITIGSATTFGTLRADGNVLVDGGLIEVSNVSSSVTVLGETMDITNGGRLIFHRDFVATGAAFNISGVDSRIESDTNIRVGANSAVNVSDGGRISAVSALRLEGGPLVVDGAGSSATADVAQWGQSQFTTTVTFSNGASGTFREVHLTDSPFTTGAEAIVRIESGADITADNLSLSSAGDVEPTAEFTITGTGSTVALNSGGMLTVGHATAGTALLAVETGGLLAVGTGGQTMLNSTGRIRINGGTANLQTLIENGGKIEFVAGSLTYSGVATVGLGGLFDTGLMPTLRLNIGDSLSASIVSVDVTGTLTLNGGTLSTDFIDVAGTFALNSGTLGTSSLVRIQPTGIIQAQGSINGSIDGVGTSSLINVNGSGISLGNATRFNGFYHEGRLNVGSNTVTLNSAGYAHLGILTTMTTGGMINAPNGVAFATGSNFFGNGAIAARVVGELGSVIEADGGLSLGDAASPAGFNFDGELRTRANTVTLNSSARAGLGNLTTLGFSASPGTLSAPNGFVVDFDEAVTGFGTLNSTNTLAKRAIINGVVQGNSAAQPITITGYVKGVGTFNHVNFFGTFDPGLSPTISTVGSITFGPTNTLIMEIGGTSRGSQYDAILASGALGLDGALQVALIDGFSPAAGNSFDLFDWASVSGTFDTLQLPALSGGLAWDTSQLCVSGVLSVLDAGLAGDYNQDGRVDAADYVVWRKSDGTQLGYDTWRANFGRTAGGGSPANLAIPEPNTLIIFASALLAIFPLRRSAESTA